MKQIRIKSYGTKNLARKALIKSARNNNLLNQEDGGESTPVNAVFDYFKIIRRTKKSDINKYKVLPMRPKVYLNALTQSDAAKKLRLKKLAWKERLKNN